MARSRNYIATPPGATIKEMLVDRGMSQKEFAARMDMSEKHISKLINGDVQLTTDMAIRLEIVLGAPAQFWSNLESIYREKLLKVEAENSIEADAQLGKLIPYNQMAELGWVPMTKDTTEKVINLRKFFEVVELPLLENRQITRIACRRLAITEKGDIALMAWAQKAKLIARDVTTMPINVKRLISCLAQIRELITDSQKDFGASLKRLKELLAECGVALVLLPPLKGSYLQGATFVDGSKIVLGIACKNVTDQKSTNKKDSERLWFNLFHELAHIVLGHIDSPNEITQQDETDADNWAREQLL